MSDNTNSAHGFTEGSEFKTETKEMEGEHDESECEFFLAEGATVFCCECGNLEMGDTTFYPKEKIDRLRSELQKAKEKEIRGDRMIVDLEHQKCVLKSDLSKAKELNGEQLKEYRDVIKELLPLAEVGLKDFLPESRGEVKAEAIIERARKLIDQTDTK